MRRWLSTVALARAIPVFAGLVAAPCQAQTPYYRGKQIEILTTTASAGMGIFSRLLIKYWGKHIDGNPTIVIREMPGAAGLTLMNYLYNAAPRDGLTIGTFDRGLVLDPLLGNANARYDASKFTSLGSLGVGYVVCFVGKHSPVQTLEQAMEHQVALGSTTPTNVWTIYPTLLNVFLKTKFKIVVGYPNSQAILLAIERRELDGMCAAWSTIKAVKADVLSEGQLIPIVQVSFKTNAELPNVPTLSSFLKDDAERQMLEFYALPDDIGRPFVAPPGIPAERTAILRKALSATAADPEFLADARQINLEIEPMKGEDMQAMIERMYTTPPKAINALLEILKSVDANHNDVGVK